MKTLKIQPKFAVINISVLILIYLLLILLTVLFSRSFVSDLLETGEVPGTIVLAVFFIIPAVLLVILLASGFTVARDVIAREPGSRFQIRLLASFFIVVMLAAMPVTLITSLSVSELMRFWRTIDIDRAMTEAGRFAMDSYLLNLEKLRNAAETADLNACMSGAEPLPQGVIAVEDFRNIDNAWTSADFSGDENRRLSAVPPRQSGFAPRELPRDTDVIRFVMLPAQDLVRVVTLDLGKDFDYAISVIENEKARFDIIDSIRFNIRRLMFFYFGVFYLPALLMTIIIAVSLSRRVAYPIEELTEATRRVADGDFSIRILSHKGDELALLIQSFNSMVGDLEKSREALLKTEKISLWQDMAQRLAHEIKNPLTPIRLSAERVLRRWQLEPEKAGEILESSMLAIIQETEGLSTLLEDFRTLSRPMEISGGFTEADDLVTELIKPYSSAHPGVEFRIGFVQNISVKIERHRLSQILSNLIINSLDAMSNEGTLEIRTDLVKKDESSYCRLSIRDTGRGISKKDAGLIFSPYFTTKESGTGLGLPIIERIVNDHGGAIWFNSGEGTGTTFYIDLPAAEKE